MAQTKRKPGRPPGSKNKKTTSKNNTANKKSKTKAKAQAKEKSAKGSRLRDEIVSIILIAVGAFLIVAFQTEAAGTIGMALSHFFKGCFGWTTYILPYYFILYGILLFTKKTIHTGIKSVVLLFIIFLMISFMNAGRFINSGTLLSEFNVHYNNGMVLEGGGAVSMMLGGIIVKLIGIPGLYILSIVVTIICLLLLMDTPVSRFLEAARDRKERRTAEREERLREKEREREKQQRQMEIEMLAAGYSKQDIENVRPVIQERASISAGQKKILGYMSDEGRVYGSGESREDEVLDFSLGENKEKETKRRGRHKAVKPEEIIETPVTTEAEQFVKEPIIVGGFSPKAAEEKLTKAEAAKAQLKEDDFNVTVNTGQTYKFPPIDLLNKPKRNSAAMEDENSLRAKAEKLEETLHSFNIAAQVTNVTQGPAVTRYEVHPNSGVKVKGIKNLADDIALNMEAKSIRIEAPIPGKAAVGIEIENERINMVTVREIIDSAAFKKAESKITFAVGKDIAGKAIVADLKSMPHMLIAGSTGSGKSVCINSIITSLLYKATPDEVKLVLIDPKVVELSNYNGIPHLLIPVVTEPVKAAAALNWAVAEMDERYRRFAEEGVRELSSYNRTMRNKGEEDKVMPQVVVIIDELADLMMAAPSQVEESICRLAQKARAAGMHLIVATQRPSVDVITGVIKANIPSRIAFAVSSQVDSRTILDMGGAEKLVGKGDMLFNPLGSGKPTRVQGTFISDQEVQDVIEFVKSQFEEVEYSENVLDTIERANTPECEKGNRDFEDELLPEAIELVVQAQQASVSMLQRRFRIGYNRAARIIDMMEDRQIIGPSDGSRPRQVLISEADLMNMQSETEELE